jgi:hypothetical protein
MWGVGGIVFVVQSRNSCDSGTHTRREGGSFIYYDYYNCTTTSMLQQQQQEPRQIGFVCRHGYTDPKNFFAWTFFYCASPPLLLIHFRSRKMSDLRKRRKKIPENPTDITLEDIKKRKGDGTHS